MLLSGTVREDNEIIYFYLKQNKTSITYIAMSPYHKEDIYNISLGMKPSYPVLSPTDMRESKNFHPDYVIGSIKSTAKEILSYGNIKKVISIVDTIQLATVRTFKESDIIINKVLENNQTSFAANDEVNSVEYIKSLEGYHRIIIESNEIAIELLPDNFKLPRSIPIKYETYNEEENDRRTYFDVSQITMEELEIIYDLKHLKELDLKAIKTIEQFEEQVMFELLEAYEQTIREGDEFYLFNDVETNGINVFNLPKLLQHTVCAISLAWNDEASRLIFTDMEYHKNVPMEYIKKRLEPLFRYDFSEKNNLFQIECKDKIYYLDRKRIKLVNTNTMFDQRAYKVHDIDIFYDYDLMMLVFALSPFHTKGKKGLKWLTEKLLGRKALSLKETLGAGNEDKFRWIKDERVAVAYACPDTVHLYSIFFKIKEIYKQCENFFINDYWNVINSQYPLVQYILANASFEGLRTDKEKFLQKAEGVKRRMDILEDLARRLITYTLNLRKYSQTKKLCKERGIPFPDMEPPSLETSIPYTGKMKGDQLRNVLYKQLKYPVLDWTKPGKNSKDPSKHIPKEMMTQTIIEQIAEKKSRNKMPWLKEDCVDAETGKVLIKADEINQSLFPVAFVLKEWTPLDTEYKNYFKPFKEPLRHGDRLFKKDSTTSIDTFRMSSAFQTIKKSVKEIILSHGENYVLAVYDKRQIELRVVAAEAKFEEMIDILDNTSKDLHKERAAISYGVSPHQITDEQRSDIKSTVFGSIYGSTVYGICYNFFGNLEKSNLGKAQLIYQATQIAFGPVFEYLAKISKQVLVPQNIPTVLREFLGIKPGADIGIVWSSSGHYKLFDITNLDAKAKKRKGNQAVNFPIQCFAGYIFKNSLIRTFKETWIRGWYQNRSFIFHLHVHDEIVVSMDKTRLCMEEVIEAIVKSSVYKLPGHPAYYVGIAFGNSWYQCKKGIEMPTDLSLQIAREWREGKIPKVIRDDVVEHYQKTVRDHMREEIIKDLDEVYPIFSKGKMDVKRLDEVFTNYLVRGYVYEVVKPLWKAEDDNTYDKLGSMMSAFYLEYIGDELLIKQVGGTPYKLTKADLDDRQYQLRAEEFFSSTRKDLIRERQLQSEFDVVLEEEIDDSEFYKNLKWSLEDDNFDYDNSQGFRFEKEDLDSRIRNEQVVSDDNKILNIRKGSKTKYKHILIMGQVAHVYVDNKNSLLQLYAKLKEMDKKYLVSQDRIKIMIHSKVDKKNKVHKEVERKVLQDIEDKLDEKGAFIWEGISVI